MALLKDLTVDGRGHYGIGASAVEKSDSLYTYLRITDIRDNGTLNMADFKSINDPDADKYILAPNDIVFARTGASTGRNYFYDGSDGTFVYAGFLIKFSIDPEKVNPLYIKYYCQSAQYRSWISSFSTGSTRGNINAQTLGNMEIPLPCRERQDYLVDVLAPLDTKIRLNEQITDNLQQQAFAIFDRLLSNGHPSECCLSQIAIINPKRILKKNEPARCIDMAQLSTSGSFPNGWEIKPYNGGMRFSNGDTLLARITPCLENGKTAYIDFLNENEVAFGSTEYVVIASQGEYPPEFFYCLARYPSFVDYAVKNMNGTSGRQRVSAETIGNYVLPVLTDDELSEFRSTVPSLFKAMKNNSIENMSLAQLRDTLLPKFMSGEIDVSNIL